MNINIDIKDEYLHRHIGLDKDAQQAMLKVIGVSSLKELIDQTVPGNIRLKDDLDISKGKSEFAFFDGIQKLAHKNKVYKSFIGLGFYESTIPSVILRNILENPGWYTQYTPYQAEIAQGRLEALINFQTMVMDLTGMEVANASLLDEATAAAEAMTMLYRLRKGAKLKNDANVFLVSDKIFPQTIDVLKTRSAPLGIELRICSKDDFNFSDDVYGAIIQFPDEEGNIEDYSSLISDAHSEDVLVAVMADLLSLTLFTPPGEYGADIVAGTTQRFGIPLGYGGPNAAYFATRDEFKRQVPGRIIGVSVDRHNNPAYRMSLQTREQHIRGEKATSNICTAQALLAIMAGMYAVWHGPEGLRTIAARIHGYTKLLAKGLKKYGYNVHHEHFFDTLVFSSDQFNKEKAIHFLVENEMNVRFFDDGRVGISIDEITRYHHINSLLNVFAQAIDAEPIIFEREEFKDVNIELPPSLNRVSSYLQHPIFNSYHSETEMMRYIKRLENKDLSLTKSMIPLGSCTMKLNAASTMMPIMWPEFSSIHPFAPDYRTQGYKELIDEMAEILCKITGFKAISFQPNSGAQGEYTGLMVIRAYHLDNGDSNRNIVLIPSSAHGTNPASATLAGMKVVIVKCDEGGNIDLMDLQEKAQTHKENLAAFMVTYPSTHGVFEENIIEMVSIIHQNGGQVYMDGANMNAQVGLTSPGTIGADVCHLNLHKTFSIPHGGGGPGMGPIGVAEHLVKYLPGHTFVNTGGEKAISAVSSTPYGSAGVLPISYAYMKMLGGNGMRIATEIAILNANYIKARLINYYPVLYRGKNGNVAHEMIIDLRGFKEEADVDVEDVAKRLMDYGFHAPTVAWPVHGTMMIEPTESESKEELDRFCDALISIYQEVQDIKSGKLDKEDNPLKMAPHTAAEISANNWEHKYTREQAAYPLPYIRESKFWPAVARVNNTYGDRNLICSCPPLESYEE